MALGWEPRFPGLDRTLVPGLYNKSTFFPNKPSVFIVTRLEAIRCWSSEPVHLHAKIRDIWVKSCHKALSRRDLKGENLQEKQKQSRYTVSYSAAWCFLLSLHGPGSLCGARELYSAKSCFFWIRYKIKVWAFVIARALTGLCAETGGISQVYAGLLPSC